MRINTHDLEVGDKFFEVNEVFEKIYPCTVERVTSTKTRSGVDNVCTASSPEVWGPHVPEGECYPTKKEASDRLKEILENNYLQRLSTWKAAKLEAEERLEEIDNRITDIEKKLEQRTS